MANLGCIDLNPHPVRADDLDHPDELRVDLDPVPGVDWAQIVRVALVAREVLADFGLTGWPKTSGSRGMHIYARIEPRWTFTQVRRAAVALAREIERRAPQDGHRALVEGGAARRLRRLQPERQGPHRGLGLLGPPDPRRPGVGPAGLGRGARTAIRPTFTIDTMPERFARTRRPVAAGIDDAAGSLDGAAGAGRRATRRPGCRDAPWPPHYDKQAGEEARVQPSKRRAAGTAPAGRADGASVVPPAPGKTSGASGRRRTSMPLIEVARAATKDEALAGPGPLEAAASRTAAAALEPADILVDSMRGRSSTWTRIRLNLRHVPEAERPPQEELEVDYDPWAGVTPPPRGPAGPA